MPLYEYQCDACGHRFERIQKFSDAPLTECPSCGGAVKKLLSSPAIQFKGSGFYITDYVRSGSNGDGGKKNGAKKDSAGEASSSADKKSEAPAASSSTTSDSASSSKSDTAKPASAAAAKD